MVAKACPRCGGNLMVQSDTYGLYIGCLQCGCILKEEEEPFLVKKATLPERRHDQQALVA